MFASCVGSRLAVDCWENRRLLIVIVDFIFTVELWLAFCIVFTGVLNP